MKIQNGFSLKPEAPEAKATKLDGQLKDASQMYENYFLNEMVRAMRTTVPRDGGMMKQNFAEKIFEQKLDQEYVEGWAKKGGVGLADMIYEQINDKFQAATQKRSFFPKGALPIAPKQNPIGIPAADSIQMKTIPAGEGAKLEYRFEVPQTSGGEFEALSPMDGKVTETQTLGEGWNNVKLEHADGLKSEMTFPGKLQPLNVGDTVGTGQKLGVLNSATPVLAWKLDWV